MATFHLALFDLFDLGNLKHPVGTMVTSGIHLVTNVKRESKEGRERDGHGKRVGENREREEEIGEGRERAREGRGKDGRGKGREEEARQGKGGRGRDGQRERGDGRTDGWRLCQRRGGEMKDVGFLYITCTEIIHRFPASLTAVSFKNINEL